MAVKLLSAQDANWNLERGAFNILIDQRPVGIAVPQSADEVSEVVRSAAADGKRFHRRRAGRDDLGLAAPELSANSGGAGALTRQVVHCYRGDLLRRSGGRRGTGGATARARQCRHGLRRGSAACWDR
jgi:hypothetical protein